jgi:acetyl-CoA synthetase (ADP-forming)
VSKATAEIAASDPDTDALLYSITTAPMLPRLAEQLAAGMVDEQGRSRKPALWIMQPGRAAEGARQVLRERGIAFTNHTGEAIDALVAWQSRSRFVPPAEGVRPANCPVAAPVTGQHDEAASKAVLGRYGVPVNASRLADSAEAAKSAARELGFPVVMKIVSADIVHKSDVGGVAVGVGGEAEVAETFTRLLASARAAVPQARIDGVSVQTMASGKLELIVGARRDAQFGPIVVIGAGGVLVELLADRAIARAPLAAVDARRLLESLSIWPVLAGYRGKPLAVDAVVDAIVRVGWLAHDLRDIDFELDVNPLIVSDTHCVAVDARLRVGN